jgi:hypothetical protein
MSQEHIDETPIDLSDDEGTTAISELRKRILSQAGTARCGGIVRCQDGYKITHSDIGTQGTVETESGHTEFVFNSGSGITRVDYIRTKKARCFSASQAIHLLVLLAVLSVFAVQLYVLVA